MHIENYETQQVVGCYSKRLYVYWNHLGPEGDQLVGSKHFSHYA